MKRIFTLFLCAITSIIVLAQAPQSMDFQSIIRDSKGNLVTNQAIGLRISILKDGISGTVVYSEIHSATTNNGGLVTVTIGSGATSDDFSSIEWGEGTYFVKTEVDVTGGTNYTLSATNQILSVPYALYAEKAGNVFYLETMVQNLANRVDSLKMMTGQRDSLTSSEFEEIKQKLVTEMTFTVPKKIMLLNETMKISADPLPWHTTNVYWSSSNEKVAKVTNGIVTPVGGGCTVISAQSGTVVKSDTIYVVLHGAFSVSSSRKVRFAHGNVFVKQNVASVFDEQYGMTLIGDTNSYFQGYTTTYYSGSYYSGQAHIPGADYLQKVACLPNSWYILTLDEFNYLTKSRTNASKLYTAATVNFTKGIILLPDNWIKPNEISLVIDKTNYATNTYTHDQWKTLEKAGAIFLPSAGLYNNNTFSEGCVYSLSNFTANNSMSQNGYYYYDYSYIYYTISSGVFYSSTTTGAQNSAWTSGTPLTMPVRYVQAIQ